MTAAPRFALRSEWPHATQPEAREVFRQLRERAGTILLGRVNYDGFLIQNATRLAADLVDELARIDLTPVKDGTMAAGRA